MSECKTHWDTDNYNTFCETHDRSHNLCIIEERDRLLLQNGEWEELVRGMADRLYAIGKEWGGADGDSLKAISTELHRRCQIIKGQDPLPAAGARLTEKRKCPVCEGGVHGKDALCDKHYSEYLGQNRARGNGPGD